MLLILYLKAHCVSLEVGENSDVKEELVCGFLSGQGWLSLLDQQILFYFEISILNAAADFILLATI